MRISVYLPLLLTVLAVRGAPVLGRRLAPAAACRMSTLIAVAAGWGTIAALVMLGCAGCFRSHEVLAGAHLSAEQLAVLDPVPRTAGVIAVLLVLAALVRVGVLAIARRRSARLLEAVTAAAPDTELVVFTDPVPRAFAVPQGGGRIVVSDGMLNLLDARQRTVLLAHERAHLHHRHHRYLRAAAMAAAVNPLLRRLAQHIAFQVERWADEDAAAAVGDRNLTARALARAALGTRTRSPGLAFTEHAATRRVRALIAAPPVSRLRSFVPAAAALIVGAAAAGDALLALGRITAALLGLH